MFSVPVTLTTRITINVDFNSNLTNPSHPDFIALSTTVCNGVRMTCHFFKPAQLHYKH